MKNGQNEFLGLLCKLYVVALLVALPLYTGEGYWKLGETKYMLFRNISLLCLGAWLAVGTSGRIWAAAKRVGRTSPGDKAAKARKTVDFSTVDCAVAAYGVCVLVSAVCSDYGSLAWTGYEGWYMGAVSQLLFVGIYFFVSRQYDGAGWPLYLGEAALCAVTVLGLLHRLGVDPLKLLIYWNYMNWEYSHMLSTLGNINWLCGYYSVALAYLAAHFLLEGRRWARWFLYAATVAAFVLLGVQGSQGGLMILAVCIAGCMLLGHRQPVIWKRIWALLAGAFFCMPLMGLAMELRGDKAAVVADGNVFGYVAWYAWIIAGIACLAVRFWSVREKGREEKPGDRRPQRRRIKIMLLSGIALGAALATLLLCTHGIDDSFGSGRGFLWRIALEGFREADTKTRLLGAGPDCYAEAVFNRLGAGTDVWKGEHWEGAVFTNAHDEFLSQLCNVGVLGMLSYLAIFLAGLHRYYSGFRRDSGSLALWTGLLALAMYGAHALVSFQQVLNAPLLFLTLGLCEQKTRHRAEP